MSDDSEKDKKKIAEKNKESIEPGSEPQKEPAQSTIEIFEKSEVNPKDSGPYKGKGPIYPIKQKKNEETKDDK